MQILRDRAILCCAVFDIQTCESEFQQNVGLAFATTFC
jgi:hypothetical protein